MFSLLLGLVLFLGIHSISIIAPLYREKLVSKNEKVYKAAYSLLSFLGIYLIVIGFGSLRANPSVIYVGDQSLRPLVYLFMLVGFVLFLAPYFPGKIKATTKNPQLLSVVFWAFSHLLITVSVADMLLFGSFLVWATVDLISMRKRQPRVVSPLKASWVNDVAVIVLGTVVYAIFAMFLHGYLFGVPLMS
ncbi:NnrU family protein [Vibrio sp. Y2-5]|uniref:NnrU family protein n=1 Tax=Vibrio TaxID=662 RepID=UPI00142E4190|nr:MULTISPECIES: NnrU family protein [Vibrio]MBD0786320.1 NnrU family protein [Vibrio sp. Y2-5]NIY92149.1 NnrU family protein [Vibrio diazotrophicus]